MAEEQEKKKIQEIMDKCGNIRDPEELAKHYNSWADIYDHINNEVVSYNGPKIAVTLFAELGLPKETRILDIGAGTGAVGEQLKTRGYTNVDAMDSSPGMLAIAEQKKVYNKLIASFVDKDTKLPAEDKIYDAVILCGCMGENHIKSNSLPQIIRLVKPGGIILWNLVDLEHGDHEKEHANRAEQDQLVQALVEQKVWQSVNGFPKVVDKFFEKTSATFFAMKVL